MGWGTKHPPLLHGLPPHRVEQPSKADSVDEASVIGAFRRECLALKRAVTYAVTQSSRESFT